METQLSATAACRKRSLSEWAFRWNDVWAIATAPGSHVLTWRKRQFLIKEKLVAKAVAARVGGGLFLAKLLSQFAEHKLDEVCRKHSFIKIHIRGREPWSSGYGRRLMFHRSWVWIPPLYTGWTFFHIPICCKNLQCVFEKPKINWKEAGVSLFFKKDPYPSCTYKLRSLLSPERSDGYIIFVYSIENLPNSIENLPNSIQNVGKYTFKILPKAEDFAKVAKICQIWSHCYLLTTWNDCRCDLR